MRIAICLHGLSTGKNDKGDSVSHKEAVSFFRKNVFTSNTDIFFHTWTTDVKEIQDSFKAKKYLGEKQVIFDTRRTKKGELTTLHSIHSRWVSALKSVELMTEYEKSHSIQYDLVMLVRFDIVFNTKVPWNTFKKGKFWISNWSEEDKNAILDLWFVASSDMIKDFAKLSNKIQSYLGSSTLVSNHNLAKRHLRELGWENRIEKWGKLPKDFTLVRRL